MLPYLHFFVDGKLRWRHFLIKAKGKSCFIADFMFSCYKIVSTTSTVLPFTIFFCLPINKHIKTNPNWPLKAIFLIPKLCFCVYDSTPHDYLKANSIITYKKSRNMSSIITAYIYSTMDSRGEMGGVNGDTCPRWFLPAIPSFISVIINRCQQKISICLEHRC